MWSRIKTRDSPAYAFEEVLSRLDQDGLHENGSYPQNDSSLQARPSVEGEDRSDSLCRPTLSQRRLQSGSCVRSRNRQRATKANTRTKGSEKRRPRSTDTMRQREDCPRSLS